MSDDDAHSFSSTQTSSSSRTSTVQRLLQGYESLSVLQLLSPLSADFHHQILPASLNMPRLNKEKFAKHAAGIFALFDEFRMTPVIVVDYPTGGSSMVAIHARMRGVLKGGKGEWTNECVMMIHLSEDGTEVVDIKEFVDSAKAREMAQMHAPKDFGTNPELGGLRMEEKRGGPEKLKYLL
ncbi:hypothetical protein F5Y16DRAFT_395278 [Xylariaceae sp. FL0255]|nr:hypothetical protein F5Y16DRAFT_395278 [Xylariaceae sp. FL0255]